ncbi:MAG: ferritin-like domain-containing protein [Polyangiaceae bacterium]|nr:ferritin-like domain-containing protein [Polyangiaceae bacterium]
MLLSREEMHFDFGGAKLDPVRDRDALAWMMNQFLYGEVTGIQIGHWLYEAPDLDAARFLSRQAVEEFQHVGNFLRIFEILGVKPGPAHPVVRFLATGMMGGAWAEHVALEMAVGEGLVLQAFYAMIELIDEPEIVSILQRGVRQEETHVDFGERRTMLALAERPALGRPLLGLALVSLWSVGRLARFMESRLPRDHAALRQLPAFLEHTVRCAELRLRRIGLLTKPLDEISGLERAKLVAEAYGHKASEAARSLALSPLRLLPGFGQQRLTDTYLRDPAVSRPTPQRQHQAGEGVEGRAPGNARETDGRGAAEAEALS